MEKLFSAFILFVVLAFISPVIGVLIGGFTGWFVGLFFEREIIVFLARVGVDVAGLTVAQVGMAMGFLGSFLRTSVTQHSK